MLYCLYESYSWNSVCYKTIRLINCSCIIRLKNIGVLNISSLKLNMYYHHKIRGLWVEESEMATSTTHTKSIALVILKYIVKLIHMK